VYHTLVFLIYSYLHLKADQKMAANEPKMGEPQTRLAGHLELTPEQRELIKKTTGLDSTKLTITLSELTTEAGDKQIAVAFGNACW
jgi:hypothetical protein